MKWHIGCSGFHYKHWRGSFYPDKLAMTKWFGYYTEHFRTLELNTTFYRFPRLPFLQKWYNDSPADFRFALKVPRAITHFKKFNDCQQMLSSFHATINEGLREKLGPVLYQLAPNYNFTEQKLEKILNAVDPTFNNVLEPRHPSWWNPDIYQRLAENNIAFCGMSHPDLPDEVIQNTPTVYYRFHGVPQLYASHYDMAALQKVVDQVKDNKSIREGWFYFNNDIGTSAVQNAKEMLSIVK